MSELARLYSKQDIEDALNLAFTHLLEQGLEFMEGEAISEFVCHFDEYLERMRVRLRSVKTPKDE